MQPNAQFLNLPRPFWADVRTSSAKLGYTVRGKNVVKIHTLREICQGYDELGLSYRHLYDGSPTELGTTLTDYFEYRARVLNDHIQHMLMDAPEAKTLYEQLRSELAPTCPLPMNKQRGSMKNPAYLTCIVNMLVEANGGRRYGCDYDPRVLTTVTIDDRPTRTLARRADGAFPSPVNPIALWEIKEYYYTTTFGSRVADAVYESLLDGMELEELREHEGIHVVHLLIVDSHNTWWKMGRSYLCRMVDMMHMGYVDEVLFGREVVERLPTLVSEWARLVLARR